MKASSVLATLFLSIGLTSAVSLAFTPQIVRHLGSRPTVKGPGYAEAMGFLLVALVSVLALVSLGRRSWHGSRHGRPA